MCHIGRDLVSRLLPKGKKKKIHSSVGSQSGISSSQLKGEITPLILIAEMNPGNKYTEPDIWL